MSEQRITIEISYDDSESSPEICGGMSISEIAQEFESENEIKAVAFYGALTAEEDINVT